MRIITDGTYFAVVRRRWIFTQILSCSGDWNKLDGFIESCFPTNHWVCSLEHAKKRMEKAKKKKYWTVHNPNDSTLSY